MVGQFFDAMIVASWIIKRLDWKLADAIAATEWKIRDVIKLAEKHF